MKIQTSNIEILKGKFTQTISQIEGCLQEANGARQMNISYSARGVESRMINIKNIFLKELNELSRSLEQ